MLAASPDADILHRCGILVAVDEHQASISGHVG